MGEAFLQGHGGVRYLLSASFPPDDNTFFPGDPSNDGRLTVVATLGNTQVTLDPDECTFSPATVAAGTTQITVTKTIGGMTRSVSVPISVVNISGVFNDNSWDTIAYIAKRGLPSRFWSIGDSKFFTMDGKNYEVKIISFTGDPLSENDGEYNDADYNKNGKRAAMALQFYTSPGDSIMHNSSSDVGYDNCYMRQNTIANLYNGLPNDLKSVIRLVKKYSGNGYYYSSPKEITTEDYLFLPSIVEYNIGNYDEGPIQFEKEKCFVYDYYKVNDPFGVQWTRSKHGPSCSVNNHFMSVNVSRNISFPSYNNPLSYYPIFNI